MKVYSKQLTIKSVITTYLQFKQRSGYSIRSINKYALVVLLTKNGVIDH